jgi:hypothetical protein
VTGARTGAAPKKPAAADLAAWWDDLATDDARRAGAAVAALIRAPEQGVASLKDRLRPAEMDDKRVAKLIADLDAEGFDRREAASRELALLGEPAEAALRQALKDSAPEARRRLEELLEKLELRPLSSRTLQRVRAVEALEHIGTAEARQVLEGLARGASGDRLTQDAKASLERLTRRQAIKP